MTMTLTTEEFELLEDLADHLDLSLRATYSGRGMFGATCIGFVGDYAGAMPNMLVRLAVRNEDLANRLANARMATDSMGRSTIWYWPTVAAPAGAEDRGDG